jgi:hypothetical protein
MVYAATSSAFMPIWIGVDVLNPGLIGLGVGRLVLAVLAVITIIILSANHPVCLEVLQPLLASVRC